jgi:hypothetical protein
MIVLHCPNSGGSVPESWLLLRGVGWRARMCYRTCVRAVCDPVHLC